MDLNFLLREKGGGYTTSLRSGGGGMKGRTGRSGFGTGLVFGFVQDIYELELWRKMWPHNSPPAAEYWKRQCARLRFLFLLLSLPLFLQVRDGTPGSDGLLWLRRCVFFS